MTHISHVAHNMPFTGPRTGEQCSLGNNPEPSENGILVRSGPTPTRQQLDSRRLPNRYAMRRRNDEILDLSSALMWACLQRASGFRQRAIVSNR